MLKKVGILLGLISITTSPWTTYDPINPLKFLLLGICGSTCLAYLIFNHKKIHLNKIVLISSLIFISQAFVSTLLSESNFTQNFYGFYGRYFGLFTWIMLFAIMMYISLVKDFVFLLKVFLTVGSISLTYSIIQYIGKDPAPWSNQFDSIIGFLGNPNFQSSFLGLFLIAISGVLIQKIKYPKYFVTFFATALVLIFLIIESNSVQGIFVILIGYTTYFMYFLYAKKYYKTFLSSIIMGITFFFFFLFSVVGLGPLASYFHRGTLAIRGDYWLAGLSMAKSNPLTGVGPDQFGTWYRFYRQPEALTRVNSELVTNSVHNGYLEFAANFGILALLSYLLILICAIISIRKYIKIQTRIDATHATLVALFAGFQGQFLISPNQIGLVIWGWVFLGAIFGYLNPYIQEREHSVKPYIKSKKTPKNIDSAQHTLVLVLGLIIGMSLTFPIFNSSMQFRTALIKADAIRIISAANSWPQSEVLLVYSAELLFSNNLQQQGLELVSLGLKEFPYSFDLWRVKKSYRYITEQQLQEIDAQLRRLDPLNPEFMSKG
jgi:O-antigen ligase